MNNRAISDLLADAVQFHYDVLERAATEAMNELTNEAIDAIDAFYHDYDPAVGIKGNYKRKSISHYYRVYHNFGCKSMNIEGTMIRPYFHITPSHDKYSGGVELNSEDFFDDYEISPDVVFWDVLKGFHGPRFLSPVPPMSPSPLQRITKARENIEKNMDMYMRLAVREVQQNNKYKVLRF